MAQAWLDAASDLNIRIEHPFTFTTKTGKTATTVGVYLPDFGSRQGLLLLCRFDSDETSALAEDTDYASSGLNPDCYERYERNHYIDTLNDWGWCGPNETRPPWYTGAYWGQERS
jgi:hypothetical protein